MKRNKWFHTVSRWLLAGVVCLVGDGAELVRAQDDPGPEVIAAADADIYYESDQEDWWGDTGGWYFQADTLVLSRGKGAFCQPLIVDRAEPARVFLTTDGTYPSPQFGPRLVLGREDERGRAWEISYFSQFATTDVSETSGVGNLSMQGDLGQASPALHDFDHASASYHTQMHNVELNRVRTEDDFSMLAGVRYFGLYESFQLDTAGLVDRAGSYKVRARNSLVGGQFGARRTLEKGAFDLILTGTAGLFANMASQSQSVSESLGGIASDVRSELSADRVHAAFVGDINVMIAYEVSPVWTLRGGYYMLWADGVALAPNQLNFNVTPGSGSYLDTGAMLFMHGVNLGVEGRW